MHPIDILLTLIRKGRWRSRKKMADLLAEVQITEAKWKKIKPRKLKFDFDEVDRIAEALDMSDFEWQKMMVLSGCKSALEETVPVSRLAWAFRCLLDSPEKWGPLFDELKKEQVPLSLQAYIVIWFQKTEHISLLREEETLATQAWLMDGFAIEVGVELDETKANIELLCQRPFLDSSNFPRRARIQELLLGLVESRSRYWVSENDVWWSDLDYYTPKGEKRYDDVDEDEWLDDHLDAIIESEQRPDRL